MKPTPQDCIEEINALLETRKINFEPGSDRVDLEGQEFWMISLIFCRNAVKLTWWIAGHTDSQGREEMNRALSQSRANAVLMELQRRRILTSNLWRKGTVRKPNRAERHRRRS